MGVAGYRITRNGAVRRRPGTSGHLVHGHDRAARHQLHVHDRGAATRRATSGPAAYHAGHDARRAPGSRRPTPDPEPDARRRRRPRPRRPRRPRPAARTRQRHRPPRPRPSRVAGTASTTTVSLSWAPRPTTPASSGYRVRRNGALVASPAGPAWKDTAAQAEDHVLVHGRGAGRGRQRERAASVSVRTKADTQRPSDAGELPKVVALWQVRDVRLVAVDRQREGAQVLRLPRGPRRARSPIAKVSGSGSRRSAARGTTSGRWTPRATGAPRP